MCCLHFSQDRAIEKLQPNLKAAKQELKEEKCSQGFKMKKTFSVLFFHESSVHMKYAVIYMLMLYIFNMLVCFELTCWILLLWWLTDVRKRVVASEEEPRRPGEASVAWKYTHANRCK